MACLLIGAPLWWLAPGADAQPARQAAIREVENMAALRALSAPAAADSGRVQLEGYYALGDKAPVFYRWDENSTATDDGGAVIGPAGHSGPGRWLLLWDRHAANAADWGLQGHGSDDTAHLQNAVAALAANGSGTVNIPAGQFQTSGLVLGGLNGTTDHKSDSTFISLHGIGEGVSQLKYIGPTNGVLLKLNRNAFADIDHLRLTNTVAKGTTECIQMTGPSFGTASQNNVFSRLLIEGFHLGWHTSGNAAGSLSGSTSSECALRDSTIVSCDYGVYNDDFNSLNHVIENVDFQYNRYGIYLALPGVSILSGSGEYNGVDICYANPTNNTGVVPIANWRSENAGCCIFACGPTSIDNVSVANLYEQPKNTLAPVALGDITIPANVAHFPSFAFGYSARSATVRNCHFQLPIYVRGNMDIDIEHCLVAGSDLMQSSAEGTRYRIRSCLTSEDLQNNQAKYPDRTGTVVGKRMTDANNSQP